MSSRKSSGRRSSQTSIGTIIVFVIIVIAFLWLQRHGSNGSSEDTTTAPPAQTASSGQSGPSTQSGATAAPSVPVGTPAAWYQLFFTTPRYPDRASYHHGSLDEHLVEFVNTATQTIDLADYDFDLASVATALAEAKDRGVRVRMVTDTDTYTNKNKDVQKAFSILKQAGITVIDDKRAPIMHNKFMVVDDAVVWTGSWNFTDGDTYHLNNNAIIIRSPDLAQNYTTEFEKMFVKKLFGPKKPAGVPHPVLTIDGVHVENYFAPEDEVADHVVDHLKVAQHSIHFLAFSFTNDDIGAAMMTRAKAGVEVAGVFETTGSETQFSEYGKMKKANLDVLQDGNPYSMHHKVIIVDGREVMFGSFNFTGSADNDNDENLLIIDDPTIAQAFEAEYQRVRSVALNPPKKS